MNYEDWIKLSYEDRVKHLEHSAESVGVDDVRSKVIKPNPYDDGVTLKSNVFKSVELENQELDFSLTVSNLPDGSINFDFNNRQEIGVGREVLAKFIYQLILLMQDSDSSGPCSRDVLKDF